MNNATCATDLTGKVGTKEYRDWCDLHGGWTFDCLLRIKETFRPRPKETRRPSKEGEKAE